MTPSQTIVQARVDIETVHLHCFLWSWRWLTVLHPGTTLGIFQSVKLFVDILHLKKKTRKLIKDPIFPR